MKAFLFALISLPAIAFAQVGVGDFNMFCSGSAGSMQLTKFGRNAAANGAPLKLSDDGYYHDSSGRLLTIQMMSSDSSAIVNFFSPNGTHTGTMTCSGEVHRYRLQYDKQGFPVRAIVPSDQTPANARYRCQYRHDGAPLQDCGNN